MKTLTTLFMLLPLLLITQGVAAQSQVPKEIERVDIQEKLGQQVLGETTFTDHNGKGVRISDYLKDGLPVLLTLNYYRCKMLCDLQLNGLLKTLRDFEWAPGDRYRIVTVSIDPREKADLAAAKRKSYLNDLGKGEVDWQFLVGDKANIQQLAGSVGFNYQYDPKTDQYGHAALTVVLSPEGQISRYIYGIEYKPTELRQAITQAAAGQVTTSLSQAILTCFHYVDPTSANRKRTELIMRISGVLIVLFLGGGLAYLWRKDLRSRRPPPSSTDNAN